MVTNLLNFHGIAINTDDSGHDPNAMRDIKNKNCG